jgi:hypothetical protein
MTLIETETVQAIIARLKAFLPAAMADSVMNYLDRPEELTEDILKVKHPKGLYLVQFVESEADVTERLIFGVYTVAVGLTQTHKLTRAAKMIVTGLKPFGGYQLDLHEDKHVNEEGGVITRCVAFRINHPAVQIPDGKLAAKIEELAL